MGRPADERAHVHVLCLCRSAARVWVSSVSMKAYRAAILRFDPALPPDACAVYDADGLLVVGPNAQGRQVVQAVGPYLELHKRFADVPVTHFAGRLIATDWIEHLARWSMQEWWQGSILAAAIIADTKK